VPRERAGDRFGDALIVGIRVSAHDVLLCASGGARYIRMSYWQAA
jgi:hypothetical protein